MNKKILLSTITSLAICSTALNAISLDEEIKQLKQTIQQQQIQIDELKSSTEDIDEIDERLEEVEIRSFTDKINLGLGMRVEMNNYSNTYANGTSYDANEIYRTKLNINMKSKISDNLKFSGKLSMYKNWGDSTARNTNYDSMQGRKPDSNALYVERAYLDWTLNPNSTVPVTLTMGRQPSSDGPSYQIKEDTSRKGTYDALAADGAADGLVLTANLNKISKGTSLRLAYGTPNVLDNEAYTSEQMNYNGKDKDSFENTKVLGLFVDQTISSFDFENLIQAYYMDASNMNANPQVLDIDSSSTTFMQNQDINVGDFALSGFMIEGSKISNKFDAFFHYSRSEAKPNGELAYLGSMGSHGLLTSTAGDTSTKSGDAIWLGTRYHINKKYKIGLEYNKGSQNWFSFTSGANDPLNKLATRGDALELYITRIINKNANIRLGYVDINYEYTGSGNHLGSTMKISTLPDSYKASTIEQTSNMYLTFNLLF